MPLYVYNCDKCDYDKDVRHSMQETPKIECKECDSIMKKVIRGTNFQLKGKGWFGKSKDN